MLTIETMHDWVHSYSKRLMKLRPQINAVVAVQHALAALTASEGAIEADPIVAAEMTARADSSVDVRPPWECG